MAKCVVLLEVVDTSVEWKLRLEGCWPHLEATEFGELVFESGQAYISLVYSYVPCSHLRML